MAHCENGIQEIFSRAKLKEAVLAYMSDADTMDLRRRVARNDLWLDKAYSPIADVTKGPEMTTQVPLVQVPNSEKPPVIDSSAEGTQEPVTEEESAIAPSKKPSSEPSRNEISGPSSFIPSPQADNQQEGEDEDNWVNEAGAKTKYALQQFQLQSKLLSSTLTPNAAILKFKGSANLTVDQVNRKRVEFLTTFGLNVISVRAEPGSVAISVARPDRKILSLSDTWQDWNPDLANGNQEILIGVREDDGRKLLFSPRKHAPHSLIAGSTNSGKSVLMQNILLSIAATNHPDKAKILLVDPKLGVDYFAFEKLPHLKEEIITGQGVAIAALNSLVEEMDRRYALLKANRVSSIFDLLEKSDATERPPVMWFIHDEFAEWMLTDQYSNSVQDTVGRLGVKARAAGIFLIFAAQRPDNRVMPMQLRANLGNRLVLKVDSEGTSEIALGEKGAENLLGKGHMCAKLEGESEFQMAQVPWISNEDIEEAADRIRGNYA